MTSPPDDQTVLAEMVGEYALGEALTVEPVSAGGPDVRKLVTSRGSFVIKPVYRPFEMELYATVEQHLNEQGIRQARLLRTTSGSAVSSSARCVLEWVPGTMHLRPSPAQCAATFRHLADYDRALKSITVPSELRTSDNVFTRVTTSSFLISEMPALTSRFGAADWDQEMISAALVILNTANDSLPTQLVHGDIGPDNVLFDGDELAAVIDFTPHDAPALFGICTALYWFFVHSREEPAFDGIHTALAAYERGRPLTATERTTWPTLLIKEALRRLATPLALAAETDTLPPEEATQRRYRALSGLMRTARATDAGLVFRP